MSEMISRRSFLKVAGLSTAGIAVFGLTGCGGGGGGNSDTIVVHRKIDLTGMTEDERYNIIAEKFPNVGGIYFGYTNAKEQNSGTVDGRALELLTIGFTVGNGSTEGKTVNLEHSGNEFIGDMNSYMSQVGTKPLDEIVAEVNAKYQTEQFEVEGTNVLATIVVGYKVSEGSQTVVDNDVTELKPNEGGMLCLNMLVESGWNQLKVKYTPNFGGGTFTFVVEPSDFIKK